MKLTSLVPACVLLLWTLPETTASDEITVASTDGGIRLSCKEGANFHVGDKQERHLDVPFKDESTGKYECIDNKNGNMSIFVKFRTCDNCIELSPTTIIGIAIGDAVATLLLGLAVYLVASQAGPGPSYRKNGLSSGPERPQPPDGRRGASNDPYQRLRFKNGAQKDTYDVISHNR